MLDKIVLSRDRKSARVFFENHSVGFHSDTGDVMTIVTEIILEPGTRLRERHERAQEDTVEIDLQLSFPISEAA